MIHKIVIEGMRYKPEELVISSGDSVIWINKDGMGHTATRVDNPSFDTGIISTDQESEAVEFNNASGEIEYFCSPHPFMRGKLIIS